MNDLGTAIVICFIIFALVALDAGIDRVNKRIDRIESELWRHP